MKKFISRFSISFPLISFFLGSCTEIFPYKTVPVTSGTIQTLLYSPKGDVLLVIDKNQTFSLLDSQTGEVKQQLSLGRSAEDVQKNLVNDFVVQFSKDGKFLYACDQSLDQGTVIFGWDLTDTTSSLPTFQRPTYHDDCVMAEDKYLRVSLAAISVSDIRTDEVNYYHSVDSLAEGFIASAVLKHGHYLEIFLTQTPTDIELTRTQLWDIQSDQKLFDSQKYTISDTTLKGNKPLLLLRQFDTNPSPELVLWDVGQQEVTQTLTLPIPKEWVGRIESRQFSDDGNRVAASIGIPKPDGTGDYSWFVWDSDSGRLVASHVSNYDRIGFDTSFSARFVVGSSNQIITSDGGIGTPDQIWNVAEDKVLVTFQQQNSLGQVMFGDWHLVVSPLGNQVAGGSLTTGTVIFWDLQGL